MFDEQKLGPAERELETALRSLRPTPARIDLAAAASKSGRRRSFGWSRAWPMAAAAAAILLVGGAWLVLKPHGKKSEGGEQRVAVNDRDHGSALEGPVEPPTLLVYRRALARSPADLEVLLDRQARAGTSSQNTGVRLTAWNADLHPSLGEM